MKSVMAWTVDFRKRHFMFSKTLEIMGSLSSPNRKIQEQSVGAIVVNRAGVIKSKRLNVFFFSMDLEYPAFLRSGGHRN